MARNVSVKYGEIETMADSDHFLILIETSKVLYIGQPKRQTVNEVRNYGLSGNSSGLSFHREL